MSDTIEALNRAERLALGRALEAARAQVRARTARARPPCLVCAVWQELARRPMRCPLCGGKEEGG